MSLDENVSGLISQSELEQLKNEWAERAANEIFARFPELEIDFSEIYGIIRESV